MKKGRYTLRHLLNGTLRSFKTKDEICRIDYAESVENEWKANDTKVKGGDGMPTRAVYNDSKESQLKITSSIFEMDQLAMLNGSTVEQGTAIIEKTGIAVVQEDTTATPHVFYINIPREIEDWNGDGVVDEKDVKVKKYENGVMGDVVVATAVTITNVGGVANTKVELTGVAKGDEVRYFHKFEVTDAIIMETLANQFAGAVEYVGDALFLDEVTEELVAAQVSFPKLKVMPGYKLNYNPSGDATKLEMTFEVLAHEQAGKQVMSTMVLYEE